jgi:DUF971 family protein
MNAYPTKLELREGTLLRIAWSDGQTREYRVTDLRAACPCATCREKRNQVLDASPPAAGTGFSLPVLSMEETRPLTISAMQPVGSYAYNIHFSDGHNTGIYTLEQLWRMGQPA